MAQILLSELVNCVYLLASDNVGAGFFSFPPKSAEDVVCTRSSYVGSTIVVVIMR